MSYSADEFLLALGLDQITTQVFRDRPDFNIFPRIRHGEFNELEPKLRRDNEKGAGVFFCVNRTDLAGRQASNITEVTNIFVDLDGTELFSEYPLDPTAIVESSPGRYHLYWRILFMLLGDFAHYQRETALKLGGDTVIIDLPRVMRLPTFTHHKGEPFESRILSLDADNVYTIQEFEEAFRTPKSIPPLPKAAAAFLAKPNPKHNYDPMLQRIAYAPKGQRNIALFRVAAAMKNDVKAGELDETEMRAMLAQAASAAGLSEREVKTTIDSALRYPGQE